MTWIQAILLAIIEGITEFLPISSTGHMIIAASFMHLYEGSAAEFTKLFTISIQFGAILAVVVLYWKRFLSKGFSFYLNIALGALPILAIGFAMRNIIDQYLQNVLLVAVMLVIGGVALIAIDWVLKRNEGTDAELTPVKAALVGVIQCVALLPGTSRSAATIVGGLALGLTRKQAAEFSFFVAVPVMFVATAYKLYKERSLLHSDTAGLLVVANVIAFAVALLVIRAMVGYVSKHGFKLFGWYRIALGLAIIALLQFGISLQMPI